jgi:MoaA/NifB/PqqE/SkfB family radical SAM enzyme
VEAGEFGPDAKAILAGRKLTSTGPTFINLSLDRSCNLQCPSCRQGPYSLNRRVDSNQFERKRALLEKILDYAHKAPTKTTINVTGMGDPFASVLFLDFITRMDGAKNPNLHLQLQTNGLLFTPENWAKLNKMHNNPISAIISLDAGSAETYALTRPGGDWARLMRNLEFVADLYRKRQLTWVRLDFVCQQLNHREMSLFVEIAKRHGFHSYFSRIAEWGSGAYHGQAFLDQDVSNPQHPEHRAFLKTVNRNFGYDKIDFGNLSEFRTPLRTFLGRVYSRFLAHRAAASAP